MKIQIICSSPGMLRNGIAHPASAFYDEGHWSEEELLRFDRDPAFTVRQVDETAENTMTSADFKLAVDTEVKRLLEEKAASLQNGFDRAVKDAFTDKTAELKADHDNALDALGKKLTEANGKIADLEQQLAEAKKPAPKK